MTTDLHGPTLTQIKEYILNSTILDFRLINGETLTGRIKWKDNVATFIETEDGKNITVFNASIMYFHTK